MAATRLILGLVPPRGVVVAPEQGYSGTRALVTEGEATGRFSVRRVDTTDADAVAAACRGADLLVVESPANPMLHLTDIRASTAAARETGALAVVDNTFCTPLLQQPLDLGADAVVHSSTKFLSGHSDVLGGIIVSGDDDLLERLRRARELAGCVPSAMDAFLILRGLRTLDVRLARAQENAQDLAQRLAQRADISAVHYPGLAHHPQRALVRRQMSGPGAMLSITLAGSAERAEAVASTTRLWTHATSLGGVESLLERRSRWPFEHPDVPPSLLRLSVGIEDVDDLWTDLADALDANPA